MRNQNWIDETNRRMASFKVSGALMDNNLVMFDVDSKSTWPQLYFTANSGPRAGECLEFTRNTVATTWGFWKTLHPETLVMSNQNSGQTTIRPEQYSVNPYEDYHAGREATPYPITRVDNRMREREVVLGVHGDGGRAAVLATRTVVDAAIGNSRVILFTHLDSGTSFAFENNLDGVRHFFNQDGEDEDGLPRFRDQETLSLWTIDGIAIEGPLAGKRLAQMPALHVYWFAWATFFPGEPILRR